LHMSGIRRNQPPLSGTGHGRPMVRATARTGADAEIGGFRGL